MAETYGTITTNACDIACAAAFDAGTTKTFVYLAVGDSGGSYYEPSKDQTALRGEKWRGECVVSYDQANKKRVIITASIPSTVGGFQVREAGVFDAEGVMMVASKQPLSDKVTPDSGASKDMTIRLYVEVCDQTAVTLTVDPSALWAAQRDLDAHVNNGSIHTSQVEKDSVSAHIADEVRHISAIERQNWTGKAPAAVSHEVTLASAGWTGDAAPYTQRIVVAGVTADNICGVSLAQSATEEQADAASLAELRVVSQDAGGIAVRARWEKPSVDIPLLVVIWG